MTAYRVVQWATGNIGTRALRSVIEHPDLSLAGVYVHSPAKAGKDAGDLCGLPATGVAATGDIGEILALGADCVLYMPAACDVDEVSRLLASGANVVTTRGEFHRPDSMNPEVRKRVEAACEQGGSSIHSTGSSPGFITEAMPLVLTSIQRRLDGLAISEYADLSQRNSPDLLFNVMGFGRPAADFDERRLSYGKVSFGPSLELVADALSIPLDWVEAGGEVAVARHQVRIAAGTIEAGTVAAQRMMVSGIRNGQPVLRFCATWYCTADLDRIPTTVAWITNRSQRVIACSHYMREQIADIFGVEEKRVTVIPNGIDPDDLQPQDPAELTRLRAEFAEPNQKLVLLIGRLVYEKGFQLALEAMPRVIEEVPETRFLVAGSGTHEKELHRQATELGLMEHGTFVGWIGDDVLHSLYRIADLTVVPSIYEPFGLVALEAMASGCPCIVADTGGLREVVPHEEAGLRFRAHDPDALAEVAVRVLSDDELGRRLVAEAYEHVRRFDWGDVAEQTAAVYADLVGEASRA